MLKFNLITSNGLRGLREDVPFESPDLRDAQMRSLAIAGILYRQADLVLRRPRAPYELRFNFPGGPWVWFSRRSGRPVRGQVPLHILAWFGGDDVPEEAA